MKNPLELIFEGYNALDELLMDMASSATKAYNFATGDTRVGLANKILTTGTIAFITGGYLSNPYSILTSIPAGFTYTHFLQLKNNKMENKEIEAIEKGLKDIEVENNKKVCKLVGSLLEFVVVKGMFDSVQDLYSSGNFSEFASRCLFMGFIESVALSCRVMRTDYLPPRKNMFKRGMDNLNGKIREYRERKALESMEPALSNQGYRKSLRLDF